MATRPPPLLLTKRLTSFLHLNLSAQVSTLLLLTHGGKLLAYASDPPIPVATLRTHGTVAASLYAIHSGGSDRETIDAALGGRLGERGGGRVSAGAGAGGGGGPLAVTIQLESGTVLVIRRLRCGMLFVCMGPHDGQTSTSASRAQQLLHHHHHQQQQQQQQQQNPPALPSGTSALTEAAAAAASTNGHHHHHHSSPSTSPQPPPTSEAPTPAPAPTPQPQPQSQQQQPHPSTTSSSAAIGSPSEAASILSAATGATAQTTSSSVLFGAGAGTAGVMATRRHAEELARWLDDKLGTLEIPGDGLGGMV